MHLKQRKNDCQCDCMYVQIKKDMILVIMQLLALRPDGRPIGTTATSLSAMCRTVLSDPDIQYLVYHQGTEGNEF